MVNKSELDDLKEIFTEFDTDQDGFISKDEFKAAYETYSGYIDTSDLSSSG